MVAWLLPTSFEVNCGSDFLGPTKCERKWPVSFSSKALGANAWPHLPLSCQSWEHMSKQNFRLWLSLSDYNEQGTQLPWAAHVAWGGNECLVDHLFRQHTEPVLISTHRRPCPGAVSQAHTFLIVYSFASWDITLPWYSFTLVGFSFFCSFAGSFCHSVLQTLKCARAHSRHLFSNHTLSLENPIQSHRINSHLSGNWPSLPNAYNELPINRLHHDVLWTTLHSRYPTEILILLHSCKIFSISLSYRPIAQTSNPELMILLFLPSLPGARPTYQ